MKLSSVYQIAIIVSDIEKAREFYVEKLGFEVVCKNYRKERDDWKLDLRVESVDETVKGMTEMGIECEPIRTNSFTGEKMTFFFDPDGLQLEIHE